MVFFGLSTSSAHDLTDIFPHLFWIMIQLYRFAVEVEIKFLLIWINDS